MTQFRHEDTHRRRRRCRRRRRSEELGREEHGACGGRRRRLLHGRWLLLHLLQLLLLHGRHGHPWEHAWDHPWHHPCWHPWHPRLHNSHVQPRTLASLRLRSLGLRSRSIQRLSSGCG